MKQWIQDYVDQQKKALDSIDIDQLQKMVTILKEAHAEGCQIFVFGNGGSAANASHFVTDLGKGSSDTLGKRFKVLSINDNVSWITAIGNDYSYDDIFRRQLENYANEGDIVLTMSVSGNSPNLVNAVKWANENKLQSIALVGRKRGVLAEIASEVIVIDSEHYGRVEDTHMGICHMLCYAFMEEASGIM